MRRARWAALAGVGLVGILFLFYWLRLPSLPTGLSRAGAGDHVRILRDAWGVPHVFGKSDADVAFGLAYAHAEDDFATIQGALLAARGRLASVFGRPAAANDYMVGLRRVWDFVDAGYERDLRPETRSLCEAYAAGLNRYAGRHPRQALPGLYPVTGRDVVAGFVHKLPLFFGLDAVLTQLYGPSRPRFGPTPIPGSNAFAVAPSRAADGYTRLAVNSHQPWEGPVAWYEVHLHSDEGWDMVGSTFPGAPLVLHGHNRSLGWAHTVNRPDLIDVYLLEVDPQGPDRYRFDEAWRDLEARPADIEVRLLGPISWTFHREALWSVHGPVVRLPHGTYALRVAGTGEVRQVEQWYRMNKARNLDEWMSAMRMQAIPTLNSVYADRQGHVAYLYNARLPVRAEGYDWSQLLPGDLGLGGGPDVLRAVYGRKASDGRLVGVAGDSYILLVEWDRQGGVSSRSINPYGTAVGDARSPHFADQAPLFAACRLKPVWMDEAQVRAHLEREYSPE